MTGASSGNYFSPTVLTEIPPDSPAYREELLGPVASLFRARDLDHALRLANDTPHGPGASLWTREQRDIDCFMDETVLAHSPAGSSRA